MGFKEEIGSEEEPTSGDRVVIIEDDGITEEGNKETIEQIWWSFLVSLNASPQLQHQSRARTYYK